MENKQTALMELLSWVKEFEDRPVRTTLTNMKEKIWQLLPKEREQIEEAFKHAQVLHAVSDETRAEQYYTQTFKQPR